jgi:hypothetical protein
MPNPVLHPLTHNQKGLWVRSGGGLWVRSGGANKKPVYCYDFFTKELVINFEAIRSMSRSLDMGLISIQRKMDNNKPFSCIYKGEPQTWILYHKPL